MGFLKKLFGVAQEDKTQTPEEKEAVQKKNFEILKYDGMRALKVQKLDYAIECFIHALDISDDLEVRDCLSQAYLSVGRFEDAVAELHILAVAQPENIEIFIRLAHISYMIEDYDTMIEACEKALGINAESELAHYLFAKALFGKNENEKAIEQLTMALSLKADYADARLLRGEVSLASEQIDEADKDAEYLLKDYPENEDILMLKARVENARQNVDEALTYLNKVVDANPFKMEAYLLRGELFMANGDEDKAKADFDYAADLKAQQTGDSENIEEDTKARYAQAGVF